MPSYTEGQKRKAVEMVDECGGSVTRAMRKRGGYPFGDGGQGRCRDARRLERGGCLQLGRSRGEPEPCGGGQEPDRTPGRF